MSWSIEEHIGEGRPWPEQVVVYRGETDESLTYARRSLSDVNKMVELMDTLAAENAKLWELVSGLEHCSQGFACDCCPLYDPSCTNHRRCESLERELGIEADA